MRDRHPLLEAELDRFDLLKPMANRLENP